MKIAIVFEIENDGGLMCREVEHGTVPRIGEHLARVQELEMGDDAELTVVDVRHQLGDDLVFIFVDRKLTADEVAKLKAARDDDKLF